MRTFTYLNNTNASFIEDLYQKYKENPDQVDSSWQSFFQGYEFSGTSTLSPALTKESSVIKLIDGFRSRGHLLSQTNPIRERRKFKADLELEYFGLEDSDLDTEFDAGHDIALGRTSLRHIIQHLHQTYCGDIGVEVAYCRNERLRHFVYSQIEPQANQPQFNLDQKKRILKKLDEAVTFENFLQTKFVGKKRFSLEGLEALIPSLDALVQTGSDLGVEEFVIGMAHRGRLNVLVNTFEKSYEYVFCEFQENQDFKNLEKGDVKYHLGKSADIVSANGKKVHLSMPANPSHLEAIGPVLQGSVYAKKKHKYEGNNKKIVPVLIHGDAALSGQGINYEMANMSLLNGYQNGGTVHIVLNNQIGFTANYFECRSSVYCTDLAKITESPVFHVNADKPESVVHAMLLAFQIRQLFGIDVYVDILGYRRYGHNEGDEPRFTQPLMYDAITKHSDVYDLYLNDLINQGHIEAESAKKSRGMFKESLQEKLEIAKSNPPKVTMELAFKDVWKPYRLSSPSDFNHSIQTGVSLDLLKKVATPLTEPIKSLSLYSKTEKLIDSRKALFDSKKVDWALAELLAYGSLLAENHPVRLSGQDSQRGTFSHRHAVLRDSRSEELYVPLNHIQSSQAEFEVYNSLLSEYAVMGFEYGYSLACPQALVIWEAQFGDFSNGAQIIIDQFISCSEYKWQRMSGLVLMLPHGYEGQGPEHSSARPERYLQLCAENNMYIANVSTPANLFHLLRRQVKNAFRKPLVLFTPKSLLRHPEVISPISDLTEGNFKEIIFDETAKPSEITQVMLCTGKIYYELLKKREELKRNSVAIVRIEQLYPLSVTQLKSLKLQYPVCKKWMWVQDEPENMGYWTHVSRFLADFNLTLIARPESASPATGSLKAHTHSQETLLSNAFSKEFL